MVSRTDESRGSGGGGGLGVYVFFGVFLVLASTSTIQLISATSSSHHQSHEINRYEKSPGTEQRLIERLFKNYNRKLRPPGATQVKFALNLNQIVNLNQKDQIMVLNAFIDHEWIDSRLTWGSIYLILFTFIHYKCLLNLFLVFQDPLQFDNISIIRVSGDQLWT